MMELGRVNIDSAKDLFLTIKGFLISTKTF